MKKIVFGAFIALAFLGASCSSDDGGSTGNGENGGGITPPNNKIKVIDKIIIDSKLNDRGEIEEVEEATVDFTYVDKKLHRVSDSDNDSGYKFIYDDKGIVKEVESTQLEYFPGGDQLVTTKYVVAEVLGLTPFNFSKLGVINSVDKGNVVDMTFYSYNDENQVVGTYSSVMKYDDKPFGAFHTLNTTGAVDLSKKTQVDFGNNKGAIMGLDYANRLLPSNNPTYLKHTLVEGKEEVEVVITYTYDADNYPVSFVYSMEEHFVGDEWDREENKYKEVVFTQKVDGSAVIIYKEL
ncbi:hypothetical protein [Myroides sp. LoEW2-1]|uniref:hypothetical protein n=1 Tax=Myroides sp. LoEW2-1 TaxID=2683192 RepID=UPI00132C00DB|nr:hypothetical protein [Myroides sp. LoEW2-1]MVX36459.1 hypothetical protein [Myroides sp. LoEW2-1]